MPKASAAMPFATVFTPIEAERSPKAMAFTPNAASSLLEDVFWAVILLSIVVEPSVPVLSVEVIN